MDFHSLLLFVVASLSLNLIPGPDVVYILSNTLQGKAKQGLKAALGLGVGYAFHTLAAVLGLSTLILHSALAFSIVKYLGAAYLLYLGLTAIRNMLQGKATFQAETAPRKHSNVFSQGVIVSILNPKVALFFLSFLPQFINLNSTPVSTQLVILGGVFSATATLCNISYALLGNYLLGKPSLSRYGHLIEGLSGALLIGLAGKIALSER